MKPPPHITIDHEAATRWPVFHQDAESAVLRILRDGNVSTHPVIQELEADYASFAGRRFAVAHNNGTSALLAAFHALDLKPGDEILVPTATFWASVLPMVWCGLVPVFCESEPDTLGMDPVDMRKRLTPRTRAVVMVHLWGLPCKVDEIRKVCAEHDLKIIEDASHAHGASHQGEPCGAIGDVSVFSLQGDKLAPAGEGGILLTDDEVIHERVIGLGDITRIIRLPNADRRFAATSRGIKTRIAPLSAALGKDSLARLKETNGIREANHRRLSADLESMGFDCFAEPPGSQRVWFEFLIRHRDPDFDITRFLEILQSMGARVDVPRYPLLHQQPFFTENVIAKIGRFPPGTELPDYLNQEFPVTARENQRMLKLPNFTQPDGGLLAEYREVFAAALAQLETDPSPA